MGEAEVRPGQRHPEREREDRRRGARRRARGGARVPRTTALLFDPSGTSGGLRLRAASRAHVVGEKVRVCDEECECRVGRRISRVGREPWGRGERGDESAELWAISRTPPTAARRTLGYRELGTKEVSSHDSAPSTEATTEARRRIAALSEAAAAAVEDGLRRLAAARGAREGGDGDDGRNARTEGNEGFTARELTSTLDGVASGAESSSARGEGDEAAGTMKAVASAYARGNNPEALGPSAWEADKENRCDPELKWSAEDAAKVHAARAAAERAEAAERAVLEQERLAREKMTMSLRELLDARVSLTAATARSVAETAASSAVFAAAEVAALKVTLNSARSKGNPDDPTSEALAEFMRKPLPEMRRVFRIDGTS